MSDDCLLDMEAVSDFVISFGILVNILYFNIIYFILLKFYNILLNIKTCKINTMLYMT